MQIQFSPDCEKDISKILQTDSQLHKRIEKQLALFAENPKHPSLRIHKLSGQLGTYWSLSVTKGIRMVYTTYGLM